jgi:hypothetical protein
MAIRSRLKALAKKMIFGSSSTTPPTPTPPVKSSPSFQHNPVKTEATMDETPQDNEPSAASAPATATESSATESPATETVVEETATSSAEVAMDPSEASYVFDVVDLFPATCPHCEASSNNNWIRIENKFACGACEEPFAA